VPQEERQEVVAALGATPPWPCRARDRSRIASCAASGTQIAVSSPARNRAAKVVASRRSVLICPPGRTGTIDGATTRSRTPGRGSGGNLQDKVTRSIADALAVKLTPIQELSIGQKETSVAAAYDSFLEGWAHFSRENPDEIAKAIPYFEEAVKLDPNYGRPYAALALVYRPLTWYDLEKTRIHQYQGSDVSYEKAYAYLKEAKKHPNSLAYQASGLFHFDNRAFLAAYDDFKQAIALDPSDSWSYAYMASILTYGGRPEEAVPYITTAMRIDPAYPSQYEFILGFAQFGMDQFEAAASSFENAISHNSTYQEAYLLLGATYGHLARKQEAESAFAKLNLLLGLDLRLNDFAYYYGARFKESKDADRIVEGLRLAGMPPY